MSEGSKRQGFASMTPERRSEIAAMGGRAAHAKGTAHEYSPGEEARAAGRKGGLARRKQEPVETQPATV